MITDGEYYESLYNNRAAVPDFQSFFDRWAARSAQARRELDVELDVPYGDHRMETMDIFRPRGEARALLMFIHGGYWRSLDKKDHSFVAAPFVNAGAAVAAINYSLCPTVKIEDIVLQCLKAGAWLYRNAGEVGTPRNRIFVAGHSAGGHLTAMCMAAQWPRWRRLQMADDVIWNGGDEAALGPQCERVHAFYLGNAGAVGPQSRPQHGGTR